jgi:hypothetical protein
LIKAAEHGHLRVVEVLLNHGVRVNDMDAVRMYRMMQYDLVVCQ